MATSQVETVSTSADRLKIGAAIAIVVAGFTGFYMIDKQQSVLQWTVLLSALVIAAVVFFLSESGRQLIAFGREAWKEVMKVVWPTRKEAGQVTLYVLVFVVVMALFLWFTDKTLEWVFYGLILGWTQ